MSNDSAKNHSSHKPSKFFVSPLYSQAAPTTEPAVEEIIETVRLGQPEYDPSLANAAAAHLESEAETPLLSEVADSPELTEAQHVAADSHASTTVRVEAFQHIIDSEVGDTTLSRVRNLERNCGLRQIYLKFEGGNPTGTHKDRIAFVQVLDALRRGYEGIMVASCGNYGSAVALAAALANLKCIVYVPEGYQTKRIDEIRNYGADVQYAPGSYEEVCAFSSKRAEERDFYDANPGGKNTSIQLDAYAQIAYEIYDELRDAPAVIAVPVSNGTALAGIYKGFVSLYNRCKTSRIPKMVAGSSFRQNPIIESFLTNSPSCVDLPPKVIRETAVNEPLINWHSSDGDFALSAIYESGGWAQYLSDKNMRQSTRDLRQLDGFSVLPASTAGILALIERHKKNPLPPDRYVAIITSKA